MSEEKSLEEKKRMNVREFIQSIITFDNVDDILEKCKNQSEKGFIYERLWDICIKFGFCNHFPKSDFTHLTGNMNTGSLKPMTTFTQYLNENVVSGNSGGCSDISLYNHTDETFTFISSKFPKTKDEISKQKSVSYYEIQNIISVIDANKHLYPQFKICLLVPDKKTVLEKVRNANKSSQYITMYMNEDNIFDKNDLNKCFLYFREDILKHIKTAKNGKINYDEIYLSPRSNLYLRFHQELITQKTSELIEKGNKSFLWGCKCRSGKTYMVGGLITKEFEKKRKLNVLIITPAPTETAPQFTNDLFNKFREFEVFKIHHVDGSKNIETIDLEESNIFVMSKHLLQRYIDDKANDKTIMKIKNLKLDIIAFDENHFSGTTELSKKILKSYSSPNTVKIYLTASYNKPLREWNIPVECQMYWDIEDEQICKSILNDENNVNKLKDKHGDTNVTQTIQWFREKGLSIKEIFQPYESMPDLYLITTMFDSERYDTIKNKIMGSKYGFCFDVLFSMNKQKTRFLYENEIKTVLRYISGSNKEVDFKNGDQSMFSRIFKTCSRKESRQPFTQIWFLPSNNINQVSKCLEQLMCEDSILKKYDILCINRKNRDLAKDIKDDIAKQEKIAKAEGKDGLILLAGNMLTLGITLNQCDVVTLLNNAISADKVLQQMYRSMTEGPGKKIGFVIDLNISRVLNTCINYTIYKKDLNNEEKIKYLVEGHLINIDVDIMEQKKINSNAIVAKLMNIWKSDPINSFHSLLRNLVNEYEEFDTLTQKLINHTFPNTAKENKVNAGMDVHMKDDDDNLQELPTGKEVTIDDTNTKTNIASENQEGEKGETDQETDEKDEEKEKDISFSRDVLPYVIPLTSILTIKSFQKDFVKMLNDIQENPELLDIFDEMSLKWWNKKDLICVIKDIVLKHFDKTSNIYNISIQFKMSLQSLIDRPKELLELIASCLKPKQKEKQELGEVYTNMTIVFDLLDRFDVYYTKKYGRSVFTEKNFKWFDPASGMGNFPVAVYLRLMEGLKPHIPDDEERKKHILENMLYMSEINKKNVFVCQHIFNMNGKYKLNLYEGDTLELDVKTLWNIDHFDVILGNPPYNTGGIRSHTGKQLGGDKKTKTVWPNFVEKSFKWLKPDGFLLFIHPLSWLKKSHSLHNVILEKYIVWMKLWDNIKSLAMINGKIPISLYILENTKNIDEKPTEIISEVQSKKIKTTSCVYLDPAHSIPLAYHSIFHKLEQFIESRGLKLDYYTKTVKTEGEQIKLPDEYSLEDGWAIDTYTIKDGLMVKRATEKHLHAKERKLIISNKASFVGAVIDEGKLGLTGSDKSYILGDRLELLLKMLSFHISGIISHFTKYRQDFLEKEVYRYLPDIRKLGIIDISEDEFYNLVGFTSDEIQQIKNPSSSQNAKIDNLQKNEKIEKNHVYPPLVVDEQPTKKIRKLRIVSELLP